MKARWNALLGLALALAYAGASGQQGSARQSVLERLNHYRQVAGVQPLDLDPQLDAAAQAHARYMANTGQLTHTQTDHSSTYFTGETLEQRLDRASASFPRNGEAVGVASVSAPAAVVDDLVAAVYHRLLLLSPGFTQAGTGVARRDAEPDLLYVAIDLGGPRHAPADEIVIYPAARQSGVERAFDPATETPNPAPDENLVGMPVTLQASAYAPLAVERFTLTAQGDSEPVQAQVLTHAQRMELPEGAAVLIPGDPLAPGTTYVATFSGSVDGHPVQRSWQPQAWAAFRSPTPPSQVRALRSRAPGPRRSGRSTCV